MSDKCLMCGEYKFWSTHTCNPCFYVWFADWEFYDIYESKYNKIFARDEEQAAIKFAEKDWEFPNNCDVMVVNVKTVEKIIDKTLDDSDEFTNECLDLIKKNSKKFELMGETTRIFYATELK